MTKIVNICDVCSEIFAGGDAPKSNMSQAPNERHSIPIFSNGEENEGLYGYTDKARVTQPSITVSARGTIGYTAIRNTPFVPIVRLITLTPNPELIDINYLYYAVRNYKFDGSGTSIPQLTVPSIKKYSFPLPTIAEQKRIALLLDNLCELIKKRKKQLAKLDELVKARFVEMFGMPVSNNNKWHTEKMNEVAPAKNYSGKFEDKVWLLNLDMVEAQTGRIIEYLYVDKSEVGNSTCTFNVDNVLYSKLRPYLNKVVIPNQPGYATSELVPLKPDQSKINREYLAYLLRSDEFVDMINEKVAGAKMPRVSMSDFREFDVPLPPLHLQNQFATFVEQVDKSKVVVQKALDEAQTLFDSLMQQYFG